MRIGHTATRGSCSDLALLRRRKSAGVSLNLNRHNLAPVFQYGRKRFPDEPVANHMRCDGLRRRSAERTPAGPAKLSKRVTSKLSSWGD